MSSKSTDTQTSGDFAGSTDRAPILFVDECVPVAPKWQRFQRDHGEWFNARSDEAPIVYAFPAKMIDHRLASLFEIGEQAEKAEKEYSELCAECSAIAIKDDEPLRYRWLQPTIDPPAVSWLEDKKRHGWTDDHIQQAKALITKANGIAERLMGSAGRLGTCPAFRAQRDALQQQWNELQPDEKPSLPLHRSVSASSRIDGLETVSVTAEQTRFARAFDQFCDTWRVNGMTTWDLPDVDGPKWPEPEASGTAGRAGQVKLNTPWHFNLLAEDGLGVFARQEHERRAEELAIKDHSSWRTYGQLFLIDFWEKAIGSRYTQQRRPRGFVTTMTALIADIVDLDMDRVTKLRKWRSALLQGRLSSLAGKP